MSLPQCCNRKLRPYTFRDEREKQIIVKTELCRKIQEGLPCEFGDRCNFAHSEEEIQLKTLQERHDAGLIDKETYCTRPCLDYVATGDCPMGSRCKCLHDPRITGQNSWWLPNCALKSTQLDVDIHVDWDGKYNFAHSHYGHPFGKGVEMNQFQDFYDTIICKDNNEQYTCPPTKPQALTEVQRLQIALAMRHDFQDVSTTYKYSPTHKILNKMCMLIQTKAFNVKNTNVEHIPLENFVPTNPDHVIVREIAFGKLCSPDSPPLALWFNILDVEECTSKEKMRPKRTERKLKDARGDVPSSLPTYAQIIKYDNKASFRYNPVSFSDENPRIERPFNIFCPKDEESYNFVSTILHHRKDILENNFQQNESTYQKDNNFEKLEKTFWSLKRHFSLFHWPINEGREIVTEQTLVPNVESCYKIAAGTHHHDIWQSFMHVTSEDFKHYECDDVKSDGNRLDVFKSLCNRDPSNEYGPSSMTPLPYIKRLDTTLPLGPQGFSDKMDLFDETVENDWKTVYYHYLSKRSHKENTYGCS